MSSRTLPLLDARGGGQSVCLKQSEIMELIPLGLTVRKLAYGDYSIFVPTTPENKAVLEKAGYSFRVPVR